MTRSKRIGFAKGTAAIILVGFVCLPPRASQSQAIVLDLTNLVQNILIAVEQTLSVAEEVQMVANQGTQILQQVQQLQNELDMLQNMVVNTTPAGTVAWGDVQRALSSLGRTVQIGLSIPYTLGNVDSVFQSRFPGFVPPTDWAAEYDSWSTTALDTLRGTLASAGQNVADAPSVQAALNRLRSANDSAQGRLEALQVGNQIASLQVEEAAKLRQLFAAQINAQNTYLGAQEAKAAGSAAAFNAWIGNGSMVVPVSRPSQGLGAVPRP
ncbi:MAG: P-type conjugative transfer protein TrbJ [bacterium]|nr:P-type conjugative transfer protein TrbJ [bacterium]